MRKIFLICISAVIILLISCKKDTTGISNIIPNLPDTTSHNFVWTADTIYAPDAWQISLYDIWGTDENNVWAVGHSDLNRYRIWHYDGEDWNNVNVAPIWHVPTYYEIFGFSENDFWIVGDGGKANLDTAVGYILHYDGSWNRVDNWDLPICLSVWGSSSNNIYFGCFEGIIVKFNGAGFIQYNINKDLQIKNIWGLNDSLIYANGILSEGPLIEYFIKMENNNICIIDSFDYTQTNTINFGMDLWISRNGELYAASGDGLTKYINGEWIFQFYSTTLYSIFGCAQNNVFTGGYQSTFYHYNGDNWKQLSFEDNVVGTIRGIWCKENYVFVIQRLGNYSRILHGKQIN